MTAYTLRQVTPLLNQTELGLFNDSRRNAIGQFSVKQLEAKLKRSRDLRDKYRDVYRRQTVSTRSGPASARQLHGGENERTLTKADVLADVVERFDTQLGKTQAKALMPARTPRHNAPGAPTQRTNPPQAQRSRRSEGDAAPAGSATLPMRGATSVGKRTLSRAERAAETQAVDLVAQRQGHAPVRARTGLAASTAAKRVTADKLAKAAPAASANGRSVTPQTAAKASPKAGGKPTPAAKAPSLPKLMNAVKRAVKSKSDSVYGDEHNVGNGLNATLDSAAVQGGARAAARGAVPTDIVAQAKRTSVLKSEPVNQKIHASARGRMKVHQASTSRRG